MMWRPTGLGLGRAMRDVLSVWRTYAAAVVASILIVDTSAECGGFPACLGVPRTWIYNLAAILVVIAFQWFVLWAVTFFAEDNAPAGRRDSDGGPTR